jgi:hypothetical protein
MLGNVERGFGVTGPGDVSDRYAWGPREIRAVCGQ